MIALAIISALAAMRPFAAHGAEDPAVPPRHAVRYMVPILNGRHVQPTEADLPGSELSARSAAIVDELYRELMNPPAAEAHESTRR